MTTDGLTLTHPDLKNSNKIILGNECINDQPPSPGVRDNHYHGTHVTGILSAETNNRDGVAGTSWNTKVYIAQVFRGDGSGTSASFAAGVRDAINNGHVQIINFSGEFPNNIRTDTTVENAIRYARDHGVLVVCAAGNIDPDDHGIFRDSIAIPALYSKSYDNVIAVGAITGQNVRASFSRYGPELNLVAPGVDILSTIPNYSCYGFTGDYLYWTLSGTSMATPFVSGVAALLLSVNPTFTPAQIRNTLQWTATKTGSSNFNSQYGFGRINAINALMMTGKPNMVAPSSGTPCCGTYRILWTSPIGGLFKIELSTDGGQSFTATLADSVSTQTPSETYFYDWNTSGYSGTNRKIRISNKAYSDFKDTSDAFTIGISDPQAPANFTLTQKQSHPWLKWTADPGVSGYKLYRWIVGHLGNEYVLFNTINDPSVSSYVDEFNLVLPNGQGALCYYKMQSFTVCAESPYTSALSIYVDPNYFEKKSPQKDRAVPARFELGQNYPNPFNPTTTIKYAIPKKVLVTLKIYNTLGAEVTTLVNENKPAGYYEVTFEGSKYASGMYFYKITAGEFTETKKLILVK